MTPYSKNFVALQKIPNMIVHLWNVTSHDHAQSGIDVFEKLQDLGFYSLIFLAQALGKAEYYGPPSNRGRLNPYAGGDRRRGLVPREGNSVGTM